MSAPYDQQDYGDVSDAAVEAAQVERWRRRELIVAGYPAAIAKRLAAAGDVDLHQAVELVERGCRPELAAEILL